MQIKGIKRGKIIELLEELNIPDGAEITTFAMKRIFRGVLVAICSILINSHLLQR